MIQNQQHTPSARDADDAGVTRPLILEIAMANSQAELQHYAEGEYQETADEILARMTYENGLTLSLDERFANSNDGSWFDF